MPKKDIDYSKTIIYKLVCNDLNIEDVYIGHTTNFIKRKATHKSKCNNIKNKNYNLKIYQTIRENGGFENWSMIEIEKYPCNDINEACARERHYYELLNSKLNTNCPGRNEKEYKKEYYIENKDKIKEYYEANKDKVCEYNKEYREKNKDKIKEQKFKVCLCICGFKYTRDNKARHEKSNRHIKTLKQQEENK
jgi:hypothetical protein